MATIPLQGCRCSHSTDTLALLSAIFMAGSLAGPIHAESQVLSASVTPIAPQDLGDGFLGIYADAAGTQTCSQIPPGSSGTLYLIATLAGSTANGIAGVEFRVQVTNTQGYFFNFAPPPNVTVQLGQPLDLTPDDPRDLVGANLAFAQCQTGRVNLGTITVFNVSGGATELRIQRRNTPSNPFFVCPLFVGCEFPFEKFCMRPCAVDEFGSGVVSRLSINDPGCDEARPCPSECSEAPCVTVTATGPSVTCPGQPTPITVTGTNCSQRNQDIDLFVEFELAGHFENVPPGQSVSAVHTFAFPVCPGISGTWMPAAGAVAQHDGCPEPYGAERWLPTGCQPCGPNRPPDCSQAHPSVATLWPPNHQLTPVSIEGITDPDGDTIRTTIVFVATDEAPGPIGSRHCPDVYFDGLNSARLRAERDGNGDGRIYLVSYLAIDSNGAECSGHVDVCVPKTPNGPCVPTRPILFFADVCGPAHQRTVAVESPALQVAAAPGGGARIDFSLESDTDVGLEIFDVRGRRVFGRDLGRVPAGGHSLFWDGSQETGHGVASGIYVFRLRAGDTTRVAKGVVLH